MTDEEIDGITARSEHQSTAGTVVLRLVAEVHRLKAEVADLKAKASDLKAVAINCERRAVAAETEAENFQRLLAAEQGRH